MKVKKVWVRISRTVKLGHEYFKLDLEEEVELDSHENDGDVIDMVYDYLDAKLQKKIEGVLP